MKNQSGAGNNLVVEKSYTNFPAAHRQPVHDGHCRLLHGHSFDFDFEFTSSSLDECGFVIDFGELKWLKKWLEDRFDHTLLVVADDPEMEVFEDLQFRHACKVVVVPAASCEHLAMWILSEVSELREFQRLSSARSVRLTAVTVHEGLNNKATYRP